MEWLSRTACSSTGRRRGRARFERTTDSVKVVARRKRVLASKVESPLLRGPVRLLDAMAIIPQIRHALPEAKLPFQRPSVLGSDARQCDGREGCCAARLRSGPLRRSSSAVCSPSRRPCSRCGARRSPPTTAPSTSRSAATSRGSARPRSTTAAARICSARCSSRPRSATSLASRSPAARCAGLHASARSCSRVAASTEIFGWMVRNPEKRLARALAKPGHELQHRFATAEPSPEQIEVAEAALAACLELERE